MSDDDKGLEDVPEEAIFDKLTSPAIEQFPAVDPEAARATYEYLQYQSALSSRRHRPVLFLHSALRGQVWDVRTVRARHPTWDVKVGWGLTLVDVIHRNVGIDPWEQVGDVMAEQIMSKLGQESFSRRLLLVQPVDPEPDP